MSSWTSQEALLKALDETNKKVEASLVPAIESHVNSEDFSPDQGLDFLDTKNTMFLSYLIDLTVRLRGQLTSKPTNNRQRLTEMKVALDKSRGLEKKLRYQIDKLLAATTSSASFAAGGEDPLQFRPNANALKDNSDDDDSSSSGGENDQEGSSGEESDDNLDDDLAAARLTVTMAKERKTQDRHNDDGVYRAPRLAAVPYTNDQVDRQAEREKRQRRRLRASEVAQTLRHQLGEVPEQEDIHGGSELGRQREAARRVAEREAEKTRFEEEKMVRLVTSRQEKKEKRRLLREENSNLAAIADLGNIVRDSTFGESGRGREHDDPLSTERHVNGKRKRKILDKDGRVLDARRGKRPVQSKNSLQAALFGGERGGKKKKAGTRG